MRPRDRSNRLLGAFTYTQLPSDLTTSLEIVPGGAIVTSSEMPKPLQKELDTGTYSRPITRVVVLIL
jgi:hypothetical protein